MCTLKAAVEVIIVLYYILFLYHSEYFPHFKTL